MVEILSFNQKAIIQSFEAFYKISLVFLVRIDPNEFSQIVFRSFYYAKNQKQRNIPIFLL